MPDMWKHLMEVFRWFQESRVALCRVVEIAYFAAVIIGDPSGEV